MSSAKRPSAEAVHPQTGGRMPLAAGYFAYFGVVGIYTPFLSVWLAHRGYSALVIGNLAALASGLRIIGPFAVAWWFDHVRSRRPWFVAAAVIVCAAWGSVQWRATGSPVDSLAVPVAMPLRWIFPAESEIFPPTHAGAEAAPQPAAASGTSGPDHDGGSSSCHLAPTTYRPGGAVAMAGPGGWQEGLGGDGKRPRLFASSVLTPRGGAEVEAPPAAPRGIDDRMFDGANGF